MWHGACRSRTASRPSSARARRRGAVPADRSEVRGRGRYRADARLGDRDGSRGCARRVVRIGCGSVSADPRPDDGRRARQETGTRSAEPAGSRDDGPGDATGRGARAGVRRTAGAWGWCVGDVAMSFAPWPCRERVSLDPPAERAAGGARDHGRPGQGPGSRGKGRGGRPLKNVSRPRAFRARVAGASDSVGRCAAARRRREALRGGGGCDVVARPVLAGCRPPVGGPPRPGRGDPSPVRPVRPAGPARERGGRGSRPQRTAERRLEFRSNEDPADGRRRWNRSAGRSGLRLSATSGGSRSKRLRCGCGGPTATHGETSDRRNAMLRARREPRGRPGARAARAPRGGCGPLRPPTGATGGPTDATPQRIAGLSSGSGPAAAGVR